jgi:hypothetical protein
VSRIDVVGIGNALVDVLSHETDDFIESKKVVGRKASSVAALMKYPREVLVVVGLLTAATIA